MRTRSQSRNNFPQQEASPAVVEPLRIGLPFLENQFQEDPPEDPPKVPMVDNQTMAELLQAPTEGYEDAISIVSRQKNQSSALAQSSTPTPVKAIEPNCVTCGGAHPYQNCPATNGNVYRDNIQEYVSQAAAANYNQGNTGFQPQMVKFDLQVNQPPAYQAPAYQAPIPQTQSVSQTNFESYIKANDAVLRNMQNQGQNVQNQCQGLQTQIANLTDMLSKLMSSNTASSSGSGTLPSNTITNPKEDLKGITTQSGVAYQGPTIPTLSKDVKQGTEVTKDQVQTPSSQSTAPV
nr:reverse transcriptase domain-containing protein [Tanacetum cinerariifolium]